LTGFDDWTLMIAAWVIDEAERKPTSAITMDGFVVITQRMRAGGLLPARLAICLL
jgi:hypothetical protein